MAFMGNSTKTLQSIFDSVKAKGIPVPTDQPGGYGTRLALTVGNDVMAAIVAERFNPKWNRAIAPSFLTNSYQQDYPQIGLVNIGWGEDVDKVDINNTAFPKPTNLPGMLWRRQLSRTSLALWPPREICWMYNQDMVYGGNQATLANPASWGTPSWPGPGKTFNPLMTSGPVIQNPIMSMIDGNGNLLIVTTLGTTATGSQFSTTTASVVGNTGIPIQVVVASIAGLFVGQTVIMDVGGGNQEEVKITGLNPALPSFTAIFTKTHGEPVTVETLPGQAPVLPANAAEGTTITDGTVVWTVVGAMSQGFRISPLPGATGPVWQITPYYQVLLQEMTSLQDVINPIPNDQKYIYQTGVEWMCKMGSPNPADRAEAAKQWPLWLESLTKLLKQNNREVDAYGAYPAESVVENVYGGRGIRNPQDPGQPY
jgi:hypothetical protein